MVAGGNRTEHALVVGGGTAGWLAACHLAKSANAAAGGLKVTLVESPDIPIIGVGEGTVPMIRDTFQLLGIRETDFIRECDATFKQSIKFVDWCKPRDDTPNYYHHIFDYLDRSRLDPAPYWLLGERQQSFVDYSAVQGRVCDAGLGPKLMTQPEYAGLTNYAYHLDAGKFAAFLTRFATEQLGVSHVRANVQEVMQDSSGFITAVQTDSAGLLEADLFVDCSGFRALLIEKAMGVEFVDKGHQLLADTAIAAQVPYATPDAPIASHTISTAKANGWIWDIGLTGRRGTGYVYSSSHTDHDEAESVLRSYLGEAGKDIDMRRIAMRIGHRQKFWSKNCVAIGLSQGFVEPLEATGILVYDVTSRLLAERLPADRAAMAAQARRFNDAVQNAWEKVIDFIKLHYVISDRDDSDFWLDNRREETVPDTLRESLEVWSSHLPSAYDFPSKYEIFNLDNFQYVLYGMHFPTSLSDRAARYQDAALATARAEAVRQQADAICKQLIPHRELIEKIKKYGLQRI